MRDIDRTPTRPPNAMAHWTQARNPLRVLLNFLAVRLCTLLPLRLKRSVLRGIGATVGPGVSVSPSATIDFFFPDLVTLERNCSVGYEALILAHEFLQDEYRTGEVVIREGALVGARAIVLPGVEIGKDAVVAAGSVVTRDVPPGATVAGSPARIVDRGEAPTEV